MDTQQSQYWISEVWPEIYHGANQNIKSAVWLTTQQMTESGVREDDIKHVWNIANKLDVWNEVKDWSEKKALEHMGQSVEQGYDIIGEQDDEDVNYEEDFSKSSRTTITASFLISSRMTDLNDKPVLVLTPNDNIKKIMKETPNAVVLGFQPTTYYHNLPYPIEAYVSRRDDTSNSFMHPTVLSPSKISTPLQNHIVDLIDNGKKSPPIGFNYDSAEEIMNTLKVHKSTEHGLDINYCFIPVKAPFGKVIGDLDENLNEVETEQGNCYLIDNKTTEKLAQRAVNEAQKSFNYVTIKNLAFVVKPAFTDTEDEKERKVEELVQFKLDDKKEEPIGMHQGRHHKHINGNATINLNNNNWISKKVRERYGDEKIKNSDFTVSVTGLLSFDTNSLKA